MDVAGPQRPAVDEPGVCLQQRRPGLDAFPGVVGGLDSPGRDQDEPVAHPGAQLAEHVQGAVLERGTRQAACPGGGDRGGVGGQVVAGDGGVGGDDPVQAQLQGEVGDGVDVVIGEVGGDLDQQRNALRARGLQRVPDGGDQGPQVGDGLQVCAVRGCWGS